MSYGVRSFWAKELDDESLCGRCDGSDRKTAGAASGCRGLSEEDPLDPSPPRELRHSMQAIVHVENAVLDANWTEGIVLRYGAFYGPETNMTAGSAQIELVHKRKFPVVGDGGAHSPVLSGRRARRSRFAQIASISSVVNPDKLAHLGPVPDFRALLSSAR